MLRLESFVLVQCSDLYQWTTFDYTKVCFLIEKAYYNYDLLFGETEFIFYYVESTNLTDLRNKLSFERKHKLDILV